MSHKDYSSPQYFAQEFNSFLQGAGKYRDAVGGKWKSQQRGDAVLFNLGPIKYEVLFESENSGLFATLEKLTSSGFELISKWPLNPKRSSSGRIAGDYFSKHFMREVYEKTQSTDRE